MGIILISDLKSLFCVFQRARSGQFREHSGLHPWQHTLVCKQNKFYWLIFNGTLTWDANFDSVARKVSKKSGALKRVGNVMTRDTRLKYFLAVVRSNLLYGSNAFWTTLSNARKNRLIRASKRGMRAVVDAPTTKLTSSISSLLNIFPLEKRMRFKLLLHTFRCVHTHALASLLLCNQYGLRTSENSTQRTTRSQSVTSLCIPHVTRCSGSISLLFTTSGLWNSLPSPPRSPTFSLHSFRQQLMKYLGFLYWAVIGLLDFPK